MNTFKETTIIGFILLVVSTILPMDGYALNKRELVNRFITSSTQNYVNKHGDNERNLTLKDGPGNPTEPATQESKEPKSIEKGESSFSWLTALLSLLLGVILGAGGMIITRRFLGKKKLPSQLLMLSKCPRRQKKTKIRFKALTITLNK